MRIDHAALALVSQNKAARQALKKLQSLSFVAQESISANTHAPQECEQEARGVDSINEDYSAACAAKALRPDSILGPRFGNRLSYFRSHAIDLIFGSL